MVKWVLISGLLLTCIDFIAQNCTSAFDFEDDGLTISFIDQSSSAAGDPIVSWLWDFGDGFTATQQNPTHVFPDPDLYTVCLSIITQGGCTDMFCFDIEICSLVISADVAQNCNGDGNIQVDLTVTDPFDAAIDINIFVDGILHPGSPFDIDDINPVILTVFVPGDGLNHSIEVQSVDVGHCNAIFEFPTPDCNSNCFLSAMEVTFTSGATHFVDIGDNFFSPVSITIEAGDLVHWTWIGDGHSTTSDATSGPDSWNSGVLSLGASYEVTITNPGIHPYYCIPHGGPGGVGMAATIVANCPLGNAFDLLISFNTTIADPAGFNLIVDGVIQPGSPFNYAGTGMNSLNYTLSGDGLQHTIEIQDVAVPSCVISNLVAAPDCGAAPTCSITVAANQTGGCGPSNQVDVEITVNDINGGTNGFQIFVDGMALGAPVPYSGSGTTITTVSIVGDGMLHTVTIEDVDDNTCTGSTSITTTNCTIPCQLSNLMVSTGNSVTHQVEVQDFQFVPQHISISSSDVVEFQWTGQIDHTSTSDAVSGPDSWDSGLLGNGATFVSPVLSEGVHPYYCIPHGGPGGAGMSGTITVQANCNNGQVSVTASFTESGGGFGGFQVLVDGVLAPGGPFTYDPGGSNQVTVMVAGDGLSHTITIQDVDDPTCQITQSIVTPDCNASTCQVNVSASETGPCNGTTLQVSVIVTDIGGGPGGFTLEVDGAVEGNYTYDGSGTTTVTIDVNGDGLVHTIFVTDQEDPTCFDSMSITTTNCTIPCQLSNLMVSTGNSVTHQVEVQDFQFVPQHISISSSDVVEFQWTGQIDHTSTSDAVSGPESWDSGLLGNGATFVSPVLSEGVHPYYCIPHGGPGGAGMSGTITVQANCNNGQVSVTASFTESGGGFGGFQVLVDGILASGGPFTYDPGGINQVTVLVAGDGLSHTITIQDVDDPTCQITQSIVTPDCNASTCQVNVSASETGPCNGTTVQVSVIVTDIGGGPGGFTLEVDGAVEGNYTYDGSGTTTVTIDVTGDGLVHTIFVTDQEDPTCFDSTSITTTNCTIPCQLSNLMVSTGNSVMHQVEVQDFQFVPQHISISSSDVVEFQWTGQIDHTSTSDAVSGPESWDSGLLGNGATFVSPVLSEGVHPYYCIPHGGPGGAGMSGTITVIPPCNTGQISVVITFTSSGGGFNGYEVLVDDQVYPDGPFQYDTSGHNENIINMNGDGLPHQITIKDIDDPSCAISAFLQTPDCNVDSCQMDIMAEIGGPCGSGDSISTNITIAHSGVGSTGFQVLIDGILSASSPYQYDTTGITMITEQVPGDGLDHTILIQDIDDQECIAGSSITTPDCILECQIFNISLSLGEPSNHIVEVQDFTFSPQNLTISLGDTVEFVWTGVVAHTTTSDTMSGSDHWDSGLLNQGSNYQVIIENAGVHPYYCIPHGGPGGVGMSGTITVLGDCENGMVPLTVNFQGLGGSNNGFNILVDLDTVSGGPFPYAVSGTTMLTVNIPGDGQSHTITVADSEDNICFTSQSIVTADCNAVECALSLIGQVNGNCSTDGYVPVDLEITSVSGSQAGFNVLLDGIVQSGSPFQYDPSGTTTLQLNVVGDSALHTLFIHDIDDVSCTASAVVETPDCSAECLIEDFQITFLQPQTHIVEVRDFDFFPEDLTIFQGDTVRFVWIGDVAHTTTSDISSGPDSWDSGLLGNGSVYDVMINIPGIHPYYCIPHGAPGGIGMAGTVMVNEICTNEEIPATICFSASNGSPNGYNVLIDGSQVEPDPVPYTSGINCVPVTIIGDGESHLIEIVDNGDAACRFDTTFLSLNCSDVCFGFESSFEYETDLQILEIQFEQTADTSATLFQWDFGDGMTSLLANPIHQFDSAQMYEVCLVAGNPEGCLDTFCQEIFLGDFICEPAFQIETEGLDIELADVSITSVPVDNWLWSFGDNQAQIGNPEVSHTYDTLGIYEVCLTIQADSCNATQCQTIDLTDPCLISKADFGYQFSGETAVQFEDKSNGKVTSRLWGFGDGSTSTVEHPFYEYHSPGTYTVCLLIFDEDNNCSSFHCEDIQILATGVSQVQGNKPLIIFPNPVLNQQNMIQIIGISGRDIGQEGLFRVFGITGQILIQKDQILQEHHAMDLGNRLSSGIYWVSISTQKQIYIGKLIVH